MPSRISDAITTTSPVVYSHHKQLDLNLVQELPDSHAWTPTTTTNTTSLDGGLCDLENNKVPMIDLDDKINAPEVIGRACKTWGVFQVKNHGISMSLLDDIESAGNNLFSLPMHQKLRAARSPDGVSGYGVARISSFFPKRMWSEGFTIVGSPLEHARQLWPQDYYKFWYIHTHIYMHISPSPCIKINYYFFQVKLNYHLSYFVLQIKLYLLQPLLFIYLLLLF